MHKKAFFLGMPVCWYVEGNKRQGKVVGYAQHNGVVVELSDHSNGYTHTIVSSDLLQEGPSSRISLHVSAADREEGLIEARWLLTMFLSCVKENYEPGSIRRTQAARLCTSLLDGLHLTTAERLDAFGSLHASLQEG